jgi:hypothetical protein
MLISELIENAGRIFGLDPTGILLLLFSVFDASYLIEEGLDNFWSSSGGSR